MSRIRVAGLGVVVAVAMIALAASAAQASLTYYSCVKASPTNTGKYSDKECSNFVGSGGKYEHGSAVGVTFTAKSKATALNVIGIGTVTCKKSTAVGKITGAIVGEDQTTFSGCATEGKRCTSPGESTGTVKTTELSTELVATESGPVEVFYAPAGGFFLSTFECEGVLLRVKGFTVGEFTSPPGGHASKKSTEVFAGEEELRTEFSDDGGAEWAGPFASEEVLTSDNKLSEALGIE